MFSFLKPLIFGLDPEVAHDLAIKSLQLNINKSVSTSFALSYHFEILRRLPRDLINASDRVRYLLY